jgi:hypothetical protein
MSELFRNNWRAKATKPVYSCGAHAPRREPMLDNMERRWLAREMPDSHPSRWVSVGERPSSAGAVRQLINGGFVADETPASEELTALAKRITSVGGANVFGSVTAPTQSRR